MSADPGDVLDALSRAQDAFDEKGEGIPHSEANIDTDDEWTVQLTKACRLLEAGQTLAGQDGYYTAVIELSFGALERSIQAYICWQGDDVLADFRDHEFAYRRAHETGLLEEETAEVIEALYASNRTESYYGGKRPTDRQADSMVGVATSVHEFVRDQIRQGGVCTCE
ncbi:MAG: DNA-binding protein [Haloarculaceae archaeon]